MDIKGLRSSETISIVQQMCHNLGADVSLMRVFIICLYRAYLAKPLPIQSKGLLTLQFTAIHCLHCLHCLHCFHCYVAGSRVYVLCVALFDMPNLNRFDILSISIFCKIALSISISISIFSKITISISISISIFLELPYRYRYRYRYFQI